MAHEEAWGWVQPELNPPEYPFSKGGTGGEEREGEEKGKDEILRCVRGDV